VLVAMLMAVSHQARRPAVSFEPFVDLEAEKTQIIDVSGIDGIGPRVVAAAPITAADDPTDDATTRLAAAKAEDRP